MMATTNRGEVLAERLALNLPRREGHDMAGPCVKCDSSDGFRLHAETGVGQCFVCNRSWSPFQLAEHVLADKQQAIDLMVEIGEFEPRDEHQRNGSNGHADPVELVARLKGVHPDSLRAYGAAEAKRGKLPVVRLPVYNETGVAHSHFDLPTDGGKGWFKKGKGSAGLFFPGRLPQPDEMWHIVEGPKDAAALHDLGLLAAGTNTNTLAVKYARLFEGANVVIVPDRDRPAEDGAQETAKRLYRLAESVSIVTLPAEFTPTKGADVRDVLAKANGEAMLRQALADAKQWEPPAAEADDDLPITNAAVEEFEDEDGKTRARVAPLPMNKVVERIGDRTGDWPRFACGALFVHDPAGITWLESTGAMFAWLESKAGVIEWHKARGCVSMERAFERQRQAARRYEAVEELPHEPPITNHYYACEFPEPGVGAALNQLVDRFCPETPIDRDLLLAAFVTPFWGGPAGSRPAFVIASDHGRGVGKSKVAQMVGHVAGGYMDFHKGEDIKVIKERLLSPEGLPRRVCLLDNVKTRNFSWAEMEALITNPVISGKRMFVGEGQRPNVLTWFCTLNGVSLSTDMAQRSVIIKLARSRKSGTWEEETIRFIVDHRRELVADIIGYLRGERFELQRHSRWGTWERDILARLPDPAEAQKVIEERQGAVDGDAEEADTIEEFFAKRLKQLKYEPAAEQVFIPSGVAAQWYNTATNERQNVMAVGKILGQFADEKRFRFIQRSKCKTHGRGFVWVGDPLNGFIATDLDTRLANNVNGAN